MDKLILESFNVVPYLDDKRIDYITSGPNVAEGWVEVRCPWCNDPSFHLGINLDSNILSCWRCGPKGNVVKYVMYMENNCRFSEAIAIMEEYQDFSKLKRASMNPHEYLNNITIPSTFIKLEYPNVTYQSITNFFHKRGFNPIDQYKNRELYFGGILGLMRHRLVLPVTLNKKIITFVGRALSDSMSPSYINWPEKESVLPIKETLYGYDDVPPGGNVVIVEGPMDQWKLGPGSVATFGIKWTLSQVIRLRALNPNKVYILYDSEEEAQISAIELSKQIWFCNTEVLALERVNDPGELTVAEGRKIMEELLS